MKFLLLPFAWLYGAVVFIRNVCYDRGLLKSRAFDVPVIVVGNLRVGGTGKTPMTLFLLSLLNQREKRTAMVSRGYGRKTNGQLQVALDHSPDEVGDEPYMIKQRFPEVQVIVDERRVRGILSGIESNEDPEVIVLDDGMQHRKVLPGLLIMLTAYHKPYYDDFLLPAGRLREPAFEANRADMIVVTKCPPKLDIHTRRSIRERIRPMHHQKVFFACETWKSLSSLWRADDTVEVSSLSDVDVLLVTGVADDQTITEQLEQHCRKVHRIAFKDHHVYTSASIDRILNSFEGIPSEQKIILTTEKDAVKLRKWSENEKFAALPVYAIQHAMALFSEDVEAFEQRIDEFIRSYH